MRGSRNHAQKTGNHGRITDAVSISEWSPAIEDRTVPGQWERNLLFGDKNSQIAILVERQSQPTRYRDGDRCTDQPREKELYRSLKWIKDRRWPVIVA
jgi:IS30 family transposase